MRLTFSPVLIVLLLSPVSASDPPSEPGIPMDGNPVVVAAGGSARDSFGEPPADDVPEPEDNFADLSLEELMNVEVVTASRRAQPIATVPYAISVITAEDIRRSGARSIPDALRLAPGIDVADLSFGNAAVSPRGSHGFLSNQVLVLVDGRQIFDSVFGGTLWGSWPFQLEDVARIEVIRGPGGVTWGANAAHGIINIITKDPADQLGLTWISSGGSRGTFNRHVGYSFSNENVRLRVSGEYENSDGFNTGGSFLRKLEDDYSGGRAGVHAIFDRGSNDTLTLSAGSALVDGGFPPPPAGLLTKRRNSGSQASFILGTWTHTIDPDSQFDLTAFINHFQISNGVPSIDYRYQQFALQLSHTFKPADAWRLTWGIDSRVDHVDTTNADPFMLQRDTVNTAIVGAYVHNEWQLAPKWSLSLGARVNYDSYGGFEPSGRVSLSHRLSDDSVLFAAVSHAFAMPPAAVRFLSIPLLGGLARVTANRDMQPPVLYAYELGYRGRLFDRLTTSVNLYWHECKDQMTLSPRLGPPGLLQTNYDNRGSASMYGVELDLRFAATETLTLLGNYTFQNLDWRSQAPWHERDAMSPPKNKAMVGVRYNAADNLFLSGHLYYVDAVTAPNPANPFVPREVDSYVRLDLLGEYEFRDRQSSIVFGVKNLLDSAHYEGGTLFLNDAQSPRMFFVEYRMQIP